MMGWTGAPTGVSVPRWSLSKPPSEGKPSIGKSIQNLSSVASGSRVARWPANGAALYRDASPLGVAEVMTGAALVAAALYAVWLRPHIEE
jgi:hypothetical protein